MPSDPETTQVRPLTPRNFISNTAAAAMEVVRVHEASIGSMPTEMIEEIFKVRDGGASLG